jgi:hypothetical protein
MIYLCLLEFIPDAISLFKPSSDSESEENLLKTQLSCKSFLMVVSELCLISDVLRLIMVVIANY